MAPKIMPPPLPVRPVQSRAVAQPRIIPPPPVARPVVAPPRPAPVAQAKRLAAPPLPPPQKPAARLPPPPRARHRPAVQAHPAPAPLLRRSPGGASPFPVIQAYFVIPAARVYANSAPFGMGYVGGSYAVLKGGASFPAQQLQNKTFLDASDANQANIQAAAKTPNLRVSDDYQMAIEDTNTDLRQAKVFYATQAIIDASNHQLDTANSAYRLTPVGGGSIEVYSVLRYRYVLRQVTVSQDRGRVVGRDVRTPVNCDDMGASVVGIRDWKTLTPRSLGKHQASMPRMRFPDMGSDITQTIADLVARLAGTQKSGETYTFDPSRELKEEASLADEIARKYVQALRDKKTDAILKEMGVNQYAAPAVGEAFVIRNIAVQDESGRVMDYVSRTRKKIDWPYHFAGVVAQSGNDRVTLENYDRSQEQKDTGRQPTLKTADPRWFFQMYGGGGQSFHSVQAPQYANPITLAVRNPGLADGPRRASPSYVTVRGLVVPIALLAITVMVVGRYYGWDPRAWMARLLGR